MKKNIVIWGYGYLGAKLYIEYIRMDSKYHLLGFADNNPEINRHRLDDMTMYSLTELIELKKKVAYSVIIASNSWAKIGLQLEEADIQIDGVYIGQFIPYKQMHFEELELDKDIVLYAGDICDEKYFYRDGLYGLSLTRGDDKHILHDITNPYPLPNESIFQYLAEDVLEHIESDKLVDVINEIHRILRKGSLFRMSLPDYNSPLLASIVLRDENDNILYDPNGGGTYDSSGVINGGHVWFPTYETVKRILKKTKFSDIRFECYFTEEQELIMKNFSDEYGCVKRVREVNEICTMIIDCYK